MAHKIPIGPRATQETRSRASALATAYCSKVTTKETALALLTAWEDFVETGWLPDPTSEFPKRGRKAWGEARDAAARLLQAYGPALRSESGTFCVNPEADKEDQVVVSAEHAACELLDALMRLADTGWLVVTGVALERFIIREYFCKIIQPEPGKTKVPLQKLRQKYPRSLRDLERLVSNQKP